MDLNERLANTRLLAKQRFHLRLEGCDINFYGDLFCLEELADFYRPHFQLDRILAPKPKIKVYVAIESEREQCGRRVQDVSDYLLPSELAETETGVWQCYRPVSGIELIVTRDDGSIYLFGAVKEELMLQLRIFVRDQILQKILERAGSVLVHASAVERNGLGLIFMGDRDAGKTSSLLAHAARGDYNVVSSDRVALRAKDLDIIGAGVPARCNIHRIAFANDLILERVASRYTPETDADKVLVPLDEIAKAAGTRVTASFTLRRVILPQIDNDCSSLTIDRVVDRSEVIEVLRDNELKGGANDRHVHWLHYFTIPVEVIDANRDAIASTIAGTIPVFRVRASHSTYVKAIETGVLDEALSQAADTRAAQWMTEG
jgi:hypothetical protein